LSAANYVLSFADGTLRIILAPQPFSRYAALGAVAAAQSGAGTDGVQQLAADRSSRAAGSGVIRSVGAGVKLPLGVD
jgi:hypothetical protein